MSTLITTTAQIGTIKDAGGNNTAMTIDSSGRVKRSVIPSWYCVRTPGTTHSISSSNSDIADWKTDSTGLGNPSFGPFVSGGVTLTSGKTITIPVTGLYHISWNLRVDNLGAGYWVYGYVYDVAKASGAQAAEAGISAIMSQAAANYYFNLGASATVQCTANQQLRVGVTGNTSGSMSYYQSNWSGHLVG